MEEIWKPIKGYEGRYEVSNLGRVKSYVVDHINGTIRKGIKTRIGYLTVTLYDTNGNIKTHPIHRLVASAFIPNPNGYPQVNHKDEDKTNNHADNLEWCTALYNVRYGTRLARHRQSMICNPHLSRKVCSVDADGNIEHFDSIGEAERVTGNSHSNIVRALKGRTKRCGKRQWFYCDDKASPTTTERKGAA
jgi:hypothetical protein